MNELVTLKGNDVFTDSIVIAEGTNNKHKNVKELIAKYQVDICSFGTLSVLNGESTGGRPEQYYQLNEEQATFLITLLRNSKKVVAFKRELVRQFYQMRRLIMEKQTSVWLEQRQAGKQMRLMETDVIKEFVEYAEEQGSKSPKKYYIHYSNLADKAVGITNREQATTNQLCELAMIENIIRNQLFTGMKMGLYYKDIFQNCKRQIELFKDIAYLNVG